MIDRGGGSSGFDAALNTAETSGSTKQRVHRRNTRRRNDPTHSAKPTSGRDPAAACARPPPATRPRRWCRRAGGKGSGATLRREAQLWAWRARAELGRTMDRKARVDFWRARTLGSESARLLRMSQNPGQHQKEQAPATGRKTSRTIGSVPSRHRRTARGGPWRPVHQGRPSSRVPPSRSGQGKQKKDAPSDASLSCASDTLVRGSTRQQQRFRPVQAADPPIRNPGLHAARRYGGVMNTLEVQVGRVGRLGPARPTRRGGGGDPLPDFRRIDQAHSFVNQFLRRATFTGQITPSCPQSPCVEGSPASRASTGGDAPGKGLRGSSLFDGGVV